MVREQRSQTDGADIDSSHLPLVASGEQNNGVFTIDDCWQRLKVGVQGNWEMGIHAVCLVSGLLGVVAAIDLQALADLRYSYRKGARGEGRGMREVVRPR